MLDKRLLLKSFAGTSTAVMYIFAISQLMAHGGQIFGETDNPLTGFAMLMLFSASAAFVGGLTFGYSVYLFFDGKKKESITYAMYSIVWLLAYTFLVFLLMLVIF